MKNRLKLIRTIKNHSAKYIADYLEIDEETYLYIETNCLSAKEEDLKKLSLLYGVSQDFLAGKKYIISRPFSSWRESEKEDYRNANAEEKEYLNYKFGNLIFGEEGATNIVLPSEVMLNEIIMIFEQLTEERKIALFNNAKGLLKEMKELGE